MNPATKSEIESVRWAYDKMEHGIVYNLYMGEEMMPLKPGEEIVRDTRNKRISPDTGKAFICKAYFCGKCGKFFIAKKKQIGICFDCMRDGYRKKLSDENKLKYTTKKNKKKKLKKKKKKTAMEIAFEITGKYPRINSIDYIHGKSFDDIFDECEGMINA